MIKIAGREIGPGHPVFVVAELSANHGQKFESALAIVQAAAAAGADAVKLQTYTADGLTIDSDAAPFLIGEGSLWAGRNLHDLYREAYTPWDWQPGLADAARDLGLIFFSSAFDPAGVAFLETMDVPAYKISSFELVDLGLIRLAAATGRPLILSTGMASLLEIEEAVGAARAAGATQIALLKCTSAYPAEPEEMNLATIPHLAATFGLPVGLSDHTVGIVAPVAATALGACIIEKHLTLSRADGGPDAAFSLEPDEFAAMTEAVRTAQRALGQVSYELQPREAASKQFRRSLFVVEDVGQGETFTEQNVRSIRPSDGLAPRFLDEVLGRQANQTVRRGTPLSWDLVG